MKHAIIMLAGLFAFPGTAAAQNFEDEMARQCGIEVGQYCWEANGGGYPTPEQCIDAVIEYTCPQFGNQAPDGSGNMFGTRNYAVIRFYELERFCSGMTTCNG